MKKFIIFSLSILIAFEVVSNSQSISLKRCIEEESLALEADDFEKIFNITKLAIEEGYDVNSEIFSLEKLIDCTLLDIAVISGRYEFVELLLKNGAHINSCGQSSSLILATLYLPDSFQAQIVKFLLDSGANVNTTCPQRLKLYGLFWALHHTWDDEKIGFFEGLENLKKEFDKSNNEKLFNFTPLLNLIINFLMNTKELNKELEFIDLIKLLIYKGADVNFRDGYLYTPLMYITQEAIRRAQALERCSEEDKAITLAQFENAKEVIKILLSAGADIHVQNDNGQTVLDVAHKGEFKQIIELFK